MSVYQTFRRGLGDAKAARVSGPLVSGDRHLLEVGEYAGIRIVSPRAFLKSLRG